MEVQNCTKWVCFYSRTGTEIEALSNALNRFPDIIVTNKKEEDVKKIFFERSRIFFLPFRPSLGDYAKVDGQIQAFLNEEYNSILYTLNGYLRILPPLYLKEKNNVYNGHPGAISLYPELKGKDPQKKAFDLKHSKIGCALHKVIPELDAGEIVASKLVEINPELYTLDQIYSELAYISLSLWVEFFRTYFPNIGNIKNFKEATAV